MTLPAAIDGHVVVRAARGLLMEAGSPAYAVVAVIPGQDDARVGALAFTSQTSASQLARTTITDEPAAKVFVVERLQRVGRYRWTIWDAAGDNRLHEEFEQLPEWL